MIVLAALLGVAQAADPACGGGQGIRDCRGSDGSAYIERRLGERVVRKGTTADGRSWSEYVSPAPGGWTLAGSDSKGLTWYQSCNRAFGIRGTNRFGKPMFVPPSQTQECTY